MNKVLIGEGGSGRVYRVWNEEAGDFAAEKASRNPLVWEAIWLKKLQGFAVPEYYGIRQSRTYWILSMEYLPGETLQKLMDKRKLSEWQLMGVMQSVIAELQKIREYFPDFVFCDLKPSNIIVNRNGKIYFIDFGSVSIAGDKKRCHGTRPYAAPEIIKGMPGKKSDIYSIGQILWQIHGWKKDLFYYLVIAPCITKREEKRQGNLHRVLKQIQIRSKLRNICHDMMILGKRIAFWMVIFVVLSIIIWYLENEYDIIKSNGVIAYYYLKE
jgi:serine/threonine protein kinase